MSKLTHFRLCPHSRGIRIALAELVLEPTLAEERPWEWRPAFLALNPAGELPVLQLDSGLLLSGAYAISEYLAEEFRVHPLDGLGVPLFPGSAEDRSETRRLVDWFHRKFDREVTRELMAEKVFPRFRPETPHTPDPELLRALRGNLAYHMSYINYLSQHRNWLAGDVMTFADMAAAAHISCVDYLDEIDWASAPAARTWYARMKSRKSMRGVLADRVPGLHPTLGYTNPDF